MTSNEVKIETILMLEERISRRTEAEKFDAFFYHASKEETLEEACTGMFLLGKKLISFPQISTEEWLMKHAPVELSGNSV